MDFDFKNAIQTLSAVFFDFGGVLASEGFREGLQAIGRKHGLDPETAYRLGSETVHDSGYLTGRGTEIEFWDLFRQRTGIAEDDDSLRSEILTRFVLRPQMFEIVRGLNKAGLLVAILSDQTDWLDRLNDRDSFFGQFARVFNSFYLGKGKRDPSIFDDVIQAVGIAPREALFVDDNPGNVERAAARGLNVMLFQHEEEAIVSLRRLLRCVQNDRRR